MPDETQVAVVDPNEILNVLNSLTRERNIAANPEHIDEQTLKEIGQTVFRGYEIDEDSREDWMKANK